MLDILFISDYVCPYCLVAKEAMKQALEETAIDAQITWQPYELTVAPKPQVDTYNDPVRRSHYQILVEPCKQLGLDMKLPPNIVPRPYTQLAFEGWYYAQEHGCGDAYNDAMYRAYFIQEQDIGQISVLRGVAEALGMDGADFEDALRSGTYTQQERAAVDYARETLQPKGVPTIYVNGKKIDIQTYTKAEMVEILTGKAIESMGEGFFCGPDGCC